MEDLNKIIGLLVLSNIKGIGPSFIKKAVRKETFSNVDITSDIEHILASSNKEFDNAEILDQIEKARELLFQCEKDDIRLIPCNSNTYPKSLKEIKDPPPIIYCKGNTELLNNKTLCIIGSREPNSNGIKIAERVGQYFSNNNWTICNGLAQGVDNFSIKIKDDIHKNVIGVLAGGLNFKNTKTLLKSTTENAGKVLEKGGLLISESLPNKKEDTFSIVKSCRIQAGISSGLLLIQSSLEGGSKFATKAFSELMRPLAVINPVAADFELPSFEANREIILNGKNGLARFADMKIEKLQISRIIVLNSKDDYKKFENSITASQDNNFI